MFKQDKTAFQGKRLLKSDLKEYLKLEYGVKDYMPVSDRKITFTPLLQRNFGDKSDNDCTITSITAIWKHFFSNMDAKDIYTTASFIAKKYFYNPIKYGTIPLFIDNICNDMLSHIKIPAKRWYAKYGKDIEFDFSDIQEMINQNKPLILNITNDGRGFYLSHSVVVVGYYICKKDNKEYKFLQIYDNWSSLISFVDYDKLNKLCSINHF